MSDDSWPARLRLIATNIRNLDLAFRQYQAFQDTRSAAVDNLNVQAVTVDTGGGRIPCSAAGDLGLGQCGVD
jgi:hypothetical protein